MKETLDWFAGQLWEAIKPSFKKDDIETVRCTSGNHRDAPHACKTGSVVYILRDVNEQVLYVGESGVSAKSRCFGDGSGSHMNMLWFSEVRSIQYYREPEMTKAERKRFEHALIFALKPRHNDLRSKHDE